MKSNRAKIIGVGGWGGGHSIGKNRWGPVINFLGTFSFSGVKNESAFFCTQKTFILPEISKKVLQFFGLQMRWD